MHPLFTSRIIKFGVDGGVVRWERVLSRILTRGMTPLSRLRWARALGGRGWIRTPPWRTRLCVLLTCAWFFRVVTDDCARARATVARLRLMDAARANLGPWPVVVATPSFSMKSPGGSGTLSLLGLATTSATMCRFLAQEWRAILGRLTPHLSSPAWPLSRRVPALERTIFVMAKRAQRFHVWGPDSAKSGAGCEERIRGRRPLGQLFSSRHLGPSAATLS